MTISLQDDESSLLQRIVAKVAAMRFFSISLMLHLALVVSLGGVVLFKKVTEVADFEGDGDVFGSSSGAEVGPPPAPEVNQPTFQPTMVPVTPPVQTMSALTSTSTISPTFSVGSVPTAMPSLSNKTVETSPLSGAAKAMPKITATALPSMMAARSTTATRREAISRNKGKDQTEQAVLKALRWFQANQNPDGSWGGPREFPTAMTSLALLSFLGHGDTNASPEFGANVSKAIDFLVKVKSAPVDLKALKGAMRNYFVYEHGIAIYALGEAYTMTKLPSIEKPLRSGIELIIKGQTKNGGWVYGYDKEREHRGAKSPTDTSVLGWQVQALKAAHLTGLDIPGVDEAITKSIEALKAVRGPKGGFGYSTPEDRYSLTGVGALVLQIEMQMKEGKTGEEKVSLLNRAKSGAQISSAPLKKMASDAVDFILDPTIPKFAKVEYDGENPDLYAWYYHTQACLNHGGGAWTRWNSMFQDEITKHQNPDGSWPEVGAANVKGRGTNGGNWWIGTGTSMGRVVYRTALCTLMLEVFYRYLPTNKALTD